MAKYSLDDFKKKLDEKLAGNDDLVIELLEDIDDSFTPKENEELEEMKKVLNITDVKLTRKSNA